MIDKLATIEYRRASKSNEVLISEIFNRNGFITVFINAHPSFSKNSPLSRSFKEFIHIKGEEDKTAPFGEVLKVTFQWLEEHKEDNFFLYMHLMDTHFPHLIESPYNLWVTEEMFQQIPSKRRKFLELGATETHNIDYTSNIFSQVEIEFLKAIYDGSLLYVDHQLDLLIKHLDSLNILDDVLIIISSDHGELLGEDTLNWQHLTLNPVAYDSLLKVPLIIFGKGIPQGVVINEITENVDIAPTLVDYLQLKHYAKYDGISLLPLIKNRAENLSYRPYAFSRSVVLGGENLYESPQVFVLSDGKSKLEWREDTNTFFAWDIQEERDFITQKKMLRIDHSLH